MVLILFIFLLQLIRLTPINRILPKMNLVQHTYPIEVYKPSFKQPFKYEFSQSIFGQVSIKPTDPEEQLTNECSFSQQSVNIQHINSISNPYNNVQSQQSPVLLYLQSKKLIFSITSNFILSVYNYSDDNRITKQVSIKLYQQKLSYNTKSPHILSAHKDKFVYIFCQYKETIGFMLQTKSIVGKIVPIKTENINITDQIIKTQEYQNRIYLLTNDSKIVVLEVSDSGQLKKISTESILNNSEIVDVSVSKQVKMLFAIGKQNNIYIYKITNSGLELHDTIHFSNSQNYKINVQNDRVYYSFFNKSHAIAQLLYNPTAKQALFIRYFPAYRHQMKQFYIFNTMLMVLVNNGIDIYQTNIDPRIVKKQSLSARHHIKGKRIIKLTHSHYLLSNQKQLYLYKIIRQPPTLKCKVSKSSLFLNVTYSGIQKVCFNQSNNSTPFYYVCNSTRNILIEIVQPKQFNHQLLLHVMLGIYLTFIILGCCFLKMWRDSKIKIILKLQKQIDLMVNQNNSLEANKHQNDTFNNSIKQSKQKIKNTKSTLPHIMSYQKFEQQDLVSSKQQIDEDLKYQNHARNVRDIILE